MPVNIWIPPLLRRHTDDREELQASGGTLADLLEELGSAGAEVLSLLLPAGDSADPGVSLFLNGRRLAAAELATPVTDGDEVDIVPGIGGGW